MLASSRLETDNARHIDTATDKPSWNLARRVLGRWRWYGCSLLFAISGETESFGSNNLMGQWLSAIGGYSVEQVGEQPYSSWTRDVNVMMCVQRLLPVGTDGVCDRVDAGVCDVDGLYAETVACAGVHELGVDCVERNYTGVDCADGGEVLCVLWVEVCCYGHLLKCGCRPCWGELCGAGDDVCVSGEWIDVDEAGTLTVALDGQTRSAQTTTKSER